MPKRRKRRPATRTQLNAVPLSDHEDAEVAGAPGSQLSASPDEATRDLLTRAADAMGALADRMETAGGPFEALPANPWKYDIPEILESLPVEPSACSLILGSGKDASLGESLTAAMIWSARDHLYAIADGLPRGRVFSMLSLCRVVWEAAGTATWLNCGGETADEILKRAIRLCYSHLSKAAKASEAIADWCWLSDGEREELSERDRQNETGKKLLESVVEHLGMTTRQLKGQSPSMTERVGPMMNALRKANPELPLLPDKAMQAFLSGAVHSDPNTLIEMLDSDIPEAGNGARTASVRSRLQPVLWHAAGPSVMMLKTVNEWWETGLNVDGADDHVRRLFMVIQDSLGE